MIAGVHVILAVRTYWDSLQTMGRLVQLDYMPMEYYADQRITPMLLVTSLALHLALFTALFVFVYSLRRLAAGSTLSRYSSATSKRMTKR